MTEFVPLNWRDQLAELLTTQTALLDIQRRHSPTISVPAPRPQEWLDARTEFAARWEALKAEGFENGFLWQEGCYECDGALTITEDTNTYEQVPNPDYVPLPEGDTITIPIVRKGLNA